NVPDRLLIVTRQPRTLAVPVPVAITWPLQQNVYLPDDESNSTTLPGFDSSCRHPLKTLTGNEHDAVLPAVSVAVQVTVVVPIGNAVPDGGTQTTVAEQLSDTVGAKVTVWLDDVGQATGVTALIGPGQTIVGGIGSTVAVAVAELLPGVGSEIELAA